MEYKKLDRLPVFRPGVGFDEATWRLAIAGLVARPLSLSYWEILRLPSQELVEDFRCEDGWEVEKVSWKGVPLSVLLRLVQPIPEARYVAVASGDFVACLPLEDVGREGVILAYELEGKPLPPEHGAPLRLVGPAFICYHSVKAVERLELIASPAPDTAKAIALGRLARKP